MNFRNFVASDSYDSAEEDSVVNPAVIPTINGQLNLELNDLIFSPESGVQKIRRVLGAFDIHVPALYDLDPEGDEIIYDLNPDTHLYIIYSLEDNGSYEFYAELTDSKGLEEIISDDEDEEELK